MNRIRFAVLAIASFVTVLIATLLSPGTWLNRALSAAICTIFSFNSTFCLANLARSSGQVMAANPPSQIATRPEFHQSDSTPQPQPQSSPVRTQPNQTGGSTTTGGSTSNVPCNPTLEKASAQPAKEIIVKGVPANFTELVVKFRADGSNEIFYTLARRLDNTDVAVIAPLHPVKLGAGGDVQLTISSKNSICPALNLRIEPLAPAAGSTERTMAKVEAFLEKLIQVSGISPDQLMGDPNNLPDGVKPLAISQWLLNNPRNPNSVKAILSGTAPILDGQKIDRQILDSLIGNSGLIDAMDALRNEISAKNNHQITLSSRFSIADKKSFDKTTYAFSIHLCDPAFVKTLQKLRECMLSQMSWEEVKESQNYKRVMFYFSVVTSLVSLIPIFKPASILMAIESFTISQLVEGEAATLPSEFTALDFNLTKYRVTKGESGTWEQINVNAESKEWELTATTVLDYILLFLSIAGVPTVKAVVKSARDATDALIAIISSFFGNYTNQGTGIKLPKSKYTVEVDDKHNQVNPSVSQSGIISLNFGTDTYQGIGAGSVDLSLSLSNIFALGKGDKAKKLHISPPKNITVTEKKAGECGQQQVSGGQAGDRRTIKLTANRGKISISYDMKPVPDRLQVVYEGREIIDTGFVSGTGAREASFEGNSSEVTVIVTGNPGVSTTEWDYILSCPQ